MAFEPTALYETSMLHNHTGASSWLGIITERSQKKVRARGSSAMIYLPVMTWALNSWPL